MSSQIVQDLIAKTYQELATPPKPSSRSRVWKSTNGYIFLIAWANASLLRILVRRFTSKLSKSEYRFKNQIDDAARSVIANIEEGYARPTTSEYLTFLGFSQGSPKEVKGDIQRARQDGLLESTVGSKITDLGIDLRDWHAALKSSVISRPTEVKGNDRNVKEVRGVFTFLYPAVDNLHPSDLTYEMFIELINKTDWHLQRLVISLEEKLSDEQKYYQVERARIRSNL